MNVHRPIMPIVHERHLKSRHLRKIKYVSTPRALFFLNYSTQEIILSAMISHIYKRKIMINTL